MRSTEMISTAPIATEKSLRADEGRVLTSARAGKIVPVAYIPLLREDRVTSGKFTITAKMAETIHPLMNAVGFTAYAHFVPFLAFERFGGMDTLNRSYQGQPEPGGSVVPFFHTMAYDIAGTAGQFWKKTGIHWVQGQQINSAPVEAYNTVVNFRRKARSQHLPLRTLYDTSLAEAFWRNSNLWHIVPDFDQAAMDGDVALSFTNSKAPLYARKAPTLVYGAKSYKVPGPTDGYDPPISTVHPGYQEFGEEVFTELQDSGVRVSLANIELAKQTVAFAKLREKYSGLEDDHIVDLLMEGIRVPDEALKQPILLDKRSTIFGLTERHAMDGASLDQSVTTGATELQLRYRTPPMNSGGVILITVEIVPEQLYERSSDAFLAKTSAATLPNFMRDFLDPEKVQIVPNKHVDVAHAAPNGTFGYAPLNHDWKRSHTRIGGKYLRMAGDPFTEDRQRFWTVEQLNPTLTDDFYLVRNLPHTVFADMLADPFEILALGRTEIVGNTVFGKALSEDTDDYENVSAQVDQSRIVQG